MHWLYLKNLLLSPVVDCKYVLLLIVFSVIVSLTFHMRCPNFVASCHRNSPACFSSMTFLLLFVFHEIADWFSNCFNDCLFRFTIYSVSPVSLQEFAVQRRQGYVIIYTVYTD